MERNTRVMVGAYSASIRNTVPCQKSETIPTLTTKLDFSNDYYRLSTKIIIYENSHINRAL
jgi:hypothetical protein